MEITDEFEFLSLWQEISGALVRIAGQISPVKKHEWQDAIDKFLKEPLTAEDERNVEELLSWYKSDIDVKKSLDELKVITKEGMDQLKGVMDQLKEHLTRQSTTGSSPQVGASEVMELSAFEEATWNGRIVCESEDGVNAVNQKYEQLKALQDELGDQILKTWDIWKRVVATYDDLSTKLNEYRRSLLIEGSLAVAGNSLSLAGTILTSCFALGLGWILTIGGFFYAVKGLKCSSKKKEPELPQLANELSETLGQLKEAIYVRGKKMDSFAQCLVDIVVFCREHPNKQVVLKECGHVSTQDILRDINTFTSRLADVCSISIKNSKEIHEERILGEEEAIVSMNKEPGVIDDDSCAVIEEERIMKLIKLITAPVIVTTGKMKQ